MDIEDYKKHSELIRDTDVYKVYDNNTLDHLILSLTELHPEQHTAGHYHDESDEVYVFISGNGQILITSDEMSCGPGDVFIIPRGLFHRVYNRSDIDLKFWSIFEKYKDRS